MARHDESELTLLNDRNIHALHEALKIERARVDETLKKAEDSARMVAQLRSEIETLRATLNAILAAR